MKNRFFLPRRDELKDAAYRVISGAGYRWTPRAYVDNLEMWYHLRQLLTRLHVTCVIDVGANEGQFRNFLRRRCGYRGPILSFEPITCVYEVIAERARRDPGWHVFNLALANEGGQKQFNVMQDTHFSSFLEPQTAGIENPDIVKKNVVVRTETVQVRRLSDVLDQVRSQHDLSRIYLKMDTQGQDFEVMKGVGAWMKSVVALQTEVPVKPLYKGMVTFTDAMQQLASYGFEVTGLFPVVRDKHLRVVEFDCVAVNAQSAAPDGTAH